MKIFSMLAGLLLLLGGIAHAEQIVVNMHAIDADGSGASIGTITITSAAEGTLFTPHLKGLTPGSHGFHVHVNPTCAAAEKDGQMVAGLAAGGHYDPSGSGRHAGPFGDGHLGDLPRLFVDREGRAEHPVMATRLKLSDLRGRSLIIHAGGDNYADVPEKLGGGGPRVACGIIE